MKSQLHAIFFALLFVVLGAAAFAEGDATPVMPLQFGGCGGVYFLVEPGAFWVDVTYSAQHAGGTTFVRVLLAGPDRTVLHDEYLTTNKAESTVRVHIETDAPARGIYALNITMPGDRYGTKGAWGFETSAAHYLAVTSRGHRDAAHEEPLDLQSAGTPGDVCFRPERGAFAVELNGYPADQKPPELFDAENVFMATLTPDARGAARFEVPADAARDASPWRLHLPSFEGEVQIDGVTRWPPGSDYPNFSLWTPDANSWFAFHENRWLIAPYHRDIYMAPADDDSTPFEVHNNGRTTRTFHVDVEFPDGSWPAELATSEVIVPAGEAVPVAVSYSLPLDSESQVCRVRVTPDDAPEVSTYASLRVHRRSAPADKPLETPIVLKPYEHENAQFGYLPDYPLTNQIYFDSKNAPYITSDAGLFHWQTAGWSETKTVGGSDDAMPFRLRSSKVAFDHDDKVYLVGEVAGKPALLSSPDHGATFDSTLLPGHGTFDIEQFSGQNPPAGPPPLVRYTQTAADPDRIWRRINTLDLFLPEKKKDGSIALSDPIQIADQCIGFSAHSGIPSSVVSRDGKVHIAWGEATDPDAEVPGVPTYVATYDCASKTLSKPALVGYGPPANDVHNTPCITMDSKGYLHVLIGTHGRTFKYAHSLEPNTAAGGWTEAEEIGPGLRQTYVGLVCGPDDTLHCVFRLWRDDDRFPASSYATLAYMREPPGEPWSDAKLLVVAAFSDYSVFYHRLTIDRAGRLFLSYDYWSTYWFYRNDHRGNRRALMMSPDGGDTWQLATGEELYP